MTTLNLRAINLKPKPSSLNKKYPWCQRGACHAPYVQPTQLLCSSLKEPCTGRAGLHSRPRMTWIPSLGPPAPPPLPLNALLTKPSFPPTPTHSFLPLPTTRRLFPQRLFRQRLFRRAGYLLPSHLPSSSIAPSPSSSPARIALPLLSRRSSPQPHLLCIAAPAVRRRSCLRISAHAAPTLRRTDAPAALHAPADLAASPTLLPLSLPELQSKPPSQPRRTRSLFPARRRSQPRRTRSLFPAAACPPARASSLRHFLSTPQPSCSLLPLPVCEDAA